MRDGRKRTAISRIRGPAIVRIRLGTALAEKTRRGAGDWHEGSGFLTFSEAVRAAQEVPERRAIGHIPTWVFWTIQRNAGT